MVMGGDSYSMVVSSNPGTAYWIDIFSQIITVKIDLFVWKDKIIVKEAHSKNNYDYNLLL